MIQKFIKKIVLFSLPLLILSLAVTMVFIRSVVSHSDSYALPEHITDIYIGDSHVEASVIDSLLPQGKNLAKSSESIYYSYYKLQSILSENPHIKQVFLGFGVHSISNFYDETTLGNRSHLIAPSYFYSLPAIEQFKQAVVAAPNFPSFVKKTRHIGKKLKANSAGSILGGFKNIFPTSEAQDSSVTKRIDKHFYEDGELRNHSATNLEYLDRIIQLCQEKGVELILLNTPLAKSYQSAIPDKFVDMYYELISSKNLNLLDYSFMKLSPDSYYPDGDHVALKGAEVMTKKLLLESNTY